MSPDAQRLLVYLSARAMRPELARTDEDLAVFIDVAERSVVDLADELLQAGHVVVARCRHPYGRWILLPEDRDPGHWAEASQYVHGLQDRGVKILVRRQHAEHALRATEARRVELVESSGQARLFH